MSPIETVLTPEPRNPSNPPRRARFIARQEPCGRVLGTFPAPLCSSARVLLSEGVQPETELQMRCRIEHGRPAVHGRGGGGRGSCAGVPSPE